MTVCIHPSKSPSSVGLYRNIVNTYYISCFKIYLFWRKKSSPHITVLIYRRKGMKSDTFRFANFIMFLLAVESCVFSIYVFICWALIEPWWAEGLVVCGFSIGGLYPVIFQNLFIINLWTILKGESGVWGGCRSWVFLDATTNIWWIFFVLSHASVHLIIQHK